MRECVWAVLRAPSLPLLLSIYNAPRLAWCQKKMAPGMDLSAPKGSSINDFISHEEFSIYYLTLIL